MNGALTTNRIQIVFGTTKGLQFQCTLDLGWVLSISHIFQTAITGQNTTNNKITIFWITNCISPERGPVLPVLWNNAVTSFMGTRFPLMTLAKVSCSCYDCRSVKSVQSKISPQLGQEHYQCWLNLYTSINPLKMTKLHVSELAMSFKMCILWFQITVIRLRTCKTTVLDLDYVWESCHSCITSTNVWIYRAAQYIACYRRSCAITFIIACDASAILSANCVACQWITALCIKCCSIWKQLKEIYA